MNTFEYDSNAEFNQNQVRIIVRLRGPIGKIKQHHQIKSSNVSSKSPSNRGHIRKNVSKQKMERSKSPLNRPQNLRPVPVNGLLSDGTKYTMFTCQEPSGIVLVSNKPIVGENINHTFKTTSDLYDFSKSILKETSLLEYDRVYNESHNLDVVYNENIKDNISNLFHGKNSSVLLFGPIDGGKSFLLRGSTDQKSNEPGLLSRAVSDLFNLVELTRQANCNSKVNNYFVVKCAAYQVYLDNVNDLLSREPRQIKIEKYYDENSVNCNLIGLTQREIRNKAEYDMCIKEAVNQRKWLSQVFKVNDLKRKSHLVISLRIEKRERTSDGITKSNECCIDNYAQIDFAELASSNYGFMEELDENDASLNGILYQNTSKVFNALCNNIVSVSAGLTPKNETKLTLCLKKTINPQSSIVFINCSVPWEYPLNQSFKALKFTNWMRNQVLNLHENRDPNMRGFEGEDAIVSNSQETINQNPSPKSAAQRGRGDIGLSKTFQEDDNAIISQQFGNMENYNNQVNKSFQYPDAQREVNQSINIGRYMGNQYPPQKSQAMNNMSALRSTNAQSRLISNNNEGNYSSNEESDLKQLRERAKRKYQSLDFSQGGMPNLSMNKSSQNILRGMNLSPSRSHQNTNPNINTMNNMHSTSQEKKLQSLENSLRQLEERSMEMTQRLDNMRLERSRCLDDSRNAVKGSTVGYLPDAEIEKIKQDHATLKSDNIIFREDINRLTDINRHLEDELIVQRQRNLELAAENERSIQERNRLEAELQKANEIIAQNKIQEQNLIETFNQRVLIENRAKEAENEVNRLREEKARFEVEYRVIKERFDELKNNYDALNMQYNSTKQGHDEEVTKIEEKIDLLTREIEKLQKENSGLRGNDEKQRQEILSLEKQRDTFKEQYQEQKNKNNLLSSKMAEIEEDFKNIMREKENERNLKQKEEELKRMKIDSKAKIVNELQSRIANYRNERLRKKNEDN